MLHDSTDLHLHPATEPDLPRVLAILEDAAAWLASRGIQQWLPGEFSTPQLLTNIRAGELYLAQFDGHDAATITLQWSDPTFWPPEDHHTAAYIHKLAVRRPFAGHGLGAQLLLWAQSQALQRGKKLLRLDCQATNSSLCRYYTQQGFTPRGQKQFGPWQAALYEKEIPLI